LLPEVPEEFKILNTFLLLMLFISNSLKRLVVIKGRSSILYFFFWVVAHATSATSALQFQEPPSSHEDA
jgi:hypothetical protein